MLTSSRLLNDIQQCTPPVGCASDRTVLRTAQDGGVSLRQVRVCASSKHPKILHHHVTGRIFP